LLWRDAEVFAQEAVAELGNDFFDARLAA